MQAAHVDGSFTVALNQVDTQVVAALDGEVHPSLARSLGNLELLPFHPEALGMDPPHASMVGPQFVMTVLNTHPSRGKYVNLLSGVGGYSGEDVIVALHNASWNATRSED